MIINPQRLVGIRHIGTVAWVEGQPVASQKSINITAGVRPFGMREIDLLPEGVDLEEAVWFVSREELKTADVKGQTAADKIRYRGDWYIIHRATLCPPPLRHWECIGIRQDPDLEGVQ